MDLLPLTRVSRASWLVLAAGTALGLGAGLAAAALTAPSYTATADLYVAVESGANASDLIQGGTAAEQKVRSYVEIATSDRVLAPVVRDLGPDLTADELADRVRASTPTESVMLSVAVTTTDPAEAARLADAVAASLIEVVTDDLEATPADGAAALALHALGRADVPTEPSAPDPVVHAVGGALGGAALALGAVAAAAAVDTRGRTRDDLDEVDDGPVLGEISFDRRLDERGLVVHTEPHSPTAESYRQLRTNLQFLDFGATGRSLVVTSSVPGEGKSTTAANLAIALAESGARVALVDGDLRRPRIAAMTGVEGAVGLTDVLTGRLSLDDALQPWGTGSLVVLPAGTLPPNPTQLLSSPAMRAVLTTLTTSADIVIVDAPPLLPVTDATLLAKVTGGALLAVGGGRVSRHQLARARAALDGTGCRTLGTVLTMAPPNRAGSYEYRYERTPA